MFSQTPNSILKKSLFAGVFILGMMALYFGIGDVLKLASNLDGLRAEATAEIAALPAGTDHFENGFVTPASCGVRVCVQDLKGGCAYTNVDYGHPEWGGACSPPPPPPPPPPAPPDLVAGTARYLTPGTYYANDDVRFNGTITNQGGSTAAGPYFNTFLIDYNDDGGPLSYNGVQYDAALDASNPSPISNHGVGATAGVSSPSTRFGFGRHSVRLCADYSNAANQRNKVVESNENNNCGPAYVFNILNHIQCSDGVDNADGEDTLADAADPGCHTDGNPSNPASWDPNDDNEADVPSADIKANGSDSDITVPWGSNATITWSSTAATTCFITNIGAVGPSGSSVTGPYTGGSATFTITCDGPGGTSAPDSVKVSPTGLPPAPDLTAVNTAPTNNQTFNNPATINFTGTISNSGTAPTAAGEDVFADVEIDWNQPSCAVASVEYQVNAGGPWTTVAAGWSQSVSATLGAANSQLLNGTHCYRIIADRGGLVTESDDTNNAGPWQTFTITNLPQCSDGISNDSDGLTDAADPGCHTDGNPGNPGSYDPSDNDETDAVTQCSDDIDNDGNGTKDYPNDPGCSSASDNSESGGSSGPSGNIDANPTSVNAGQTTIVSWTTQNTSSCSLVRVSGSNGDSWNGTSNAGQTSSALNVDTTYNLLCDSVVLDTVLVTVAPVITQPSISSSKQFARLNEPFTLTWNTGSSAPASCTISGGQIASYVPSSVTGTIPPNAVGSLTMQGTATYTINCGGSTDSVTVRLVPGLWEG